MTLPTTFKTPIDICNRGLDHTGTSPITDFTDDSKAARVMRTLYDKLRQAELRRNIWRFSIREVALRSFSPTTMTLVPAAYNAAKTYVQGSVVASAGVFFWARGDVPLAVAPGYPNEAYWTTYYGPLTCDAYDPTIAYYSGEIVYKIVGTSYRVYLSLGTGNKDDPTAAPPAYDATKTYFRDETVTYSAVVYQSTIDLNLANTPTGAAPWVVVPGTQADQDEGQNWLKLDSSLVREKFIYPIGSGPSDQSTTRNIYRLPCGYLRKAPRNPKAGINPWLGAPSGLAEDDWNLEGDWLTTMDTQVIMFRFVADIADVTRMDPMFCEGLGARIGFEACESLTQSTEKLKTIGASYKTFMGEARAVNGIEVGAEEPPVDSYITARM